MIFVRLGAAALIGLGAGTAAQQAPQPQQPATATAQKASPDDKVSCRVSKDGNALRRTCMTKAQWRKLDSQAQDGDESALRNPRCPLGAC